MLETMGFSTPHLLLLNKSNIFSPLFGDKKVQNHSPMHKKLKEFSKCSDHEKTRKLLFFKDLKDEELCSL